jgi:hypothetical protein
MLSMQEWSHDKLLPMFSSMFQPLKSTEFIIQNVFAAKIEMTVLTSWALFLTLLDISRN